MNTNGTEYRIPSPSPDVEFPFMFGRLMGYTSRPEVEAYLEKLLGEDGLSDFKRMLHNVAEGFYRDCRERIEK